MNHYEYMMNGIFHGSVRSTVVSKVHEMTKNHSGSLSNAVINKYYRPVGNMQVGAQEMKALLYISFIETIKNAKTPLIFTDFMDIVDDVYSRFTTVGDIKSMSLGRHTGVHTALMFYDYYQLANFELNGKRSYELSEGLFYNLLNTDIGGVETDDVRLPYNAISIVLPPNPYNFRYYNEFGGLIESKLREVYIVEATTGYRMWHIMLVGDTHESYSRAKGMLLLGLHEGKLLTDVINSQNVGSDTDDMLDVDATRPLIKTLFNIIIYATWADADVEHIVLNEEARKLWQKIQKVPSGTRTRNNLELKYRDIVPQERIILGKKTIINRHRTEYITDGVSSEGKKLEIRTLVQGHWRHYWVGKGRTCRERKWIKPFWRGPENAPISHASHLLRTS